MRHVVWAVALFCFFVAATAAADEVPRKSFIVGFADFKSEVGAAPSPDEQFVIDYLRRVAEAAPAQAMFATHFEYVRGNYYQILEWMWDGRIDAAVVSPFMLNVLKINDRNTFEPVVEFRARGLGDQLDGNLPVFRAVTNGRAESDPDAALADCLTAQPGECEFRFVTHVSTTGPTSTGPTVAVPGRPSSSRPRMMRSMRCTSWSMRSR